MIIMIVNAGFHDQGKICCGKRDEIFDMTEFFPGEIFPIQIYYPGKYFFQTDFPQRIFFLMENLNHFICFVPFFPICPDFVPFCTFLQLLVLLAPLCTFFY